MCGIAGVITKDNIKLSKEKMTKRNKIFQGLLVAMEDRGGQSAGVAFIDKGIIKIAKSPVKASIFINNKRFKKLLNANYPLIIGHTRLATTGDVSKRNAHPFLRSDIVGVHNGIIYNQESFHKFNYEVDSEIIFDLLARSNNNYKKSFKKLSGNFAIAWTKIQKDKYELYLVRDGNPLYLAYVKELKTWFYCSTMEALQAVILSHYNSIDLKSLPLCKVVTVSQDLKMKKEDVSFKWQSYNYNGRSYAYDDEDYYSRPKQTFSINDHKIEEDTKDLTDDVNDTCSKCGDFIEACRCVFRCDECFMPIDGEYFLTKDGTVLCPDCKEYQKTSARRYILPD